MKKIFIPAFLLLFSVAGFSQGPDVWNIFARTTFEPRFDEKVGEYLFYPKFSDEVRALQGRQVTLRGFYVPFAPEGDDYVIISKYPMSQCFFCGGGGPESVAEVNFAKDAPRFKVDDLITVRGRLKLNSDDPDHINFILTEAELVNE